jgi:ParB family chromosome partitioning protein
MKSSAKNIQLTSFDDIFKTTDEIKDESKEKVREIPLNELHPFKNHPFHVYDDEDMQKITDSIREYGVLVPAIVRPRSEGGYELISGHRRKHGSELVGKETMPVIIRELDDDEATIIMVDSNLQRETLLPSEKAFAYKMKLEAMKRQGKRNDLTSSQVGTKSERSDDLLASQVGESRNQVQRYIRLTELVPKFMSMVDSKKISFNPAVELSYLKKEEQSILLDIIEMEDSIPSLSQAQRLKKYSQDGKLDENVMDAIMTEAKAENIKVTLPGKKLRRYFPAEYTQEQIEITIFKLLEDYKNINSWRG